MIDIKIYMVMGQCAVEVKLSEGNSRTIDAGTWYGVLSESSPLSDLCSNITNALRSVDSYAEDITGELRTG